MMLILQQTHIDTNAKINSIKQFFFSFDDDYTVSISI